MSLLLEFNRLVRKVVMTEGGPKPIKQKGKTGYVVTMTYEKWDEESLEAGDTDDRGFEFKDEKLKTLDDVARYVPSNKYGWHEWSGLPASPGDWLTSSPDENFRTGGHTIYGLHITHGDKTPLTREEMAYLSQKLHVRWR